eukprot:3404326-Alexandrium_andersonii.AAC.1
MSTEQRIDTLEQRAQQLGNFAEQARQEFQTVTNRIQTLKQEVDRQDSTGNTGTVLQQREASDRDQHGVHAKPRNTCAFRKRQRQLIVQGHTGLGGVPWR